MGMFVGFGQFFGLTSPGRVECDEGVHVLVTGATLQPGRGVVEETLDAVRLERERGFGIFD